MQQLLLDPFSGISGDMFLGALIDVGLPAEWLQQLPARCGIPDVAVRVQEVLRCEIVCQKVEFDIPPQPHGRHIREIEQIVDGLPAPAEVKQQAKAAFRLIAEQEARIHGSSVSEVHLHEVGAVDAILDIVGSVWGVAELGVREVRCGPIALGDGSVRAAHGLLPVPAPATLRLLEGVPVQSGPSGSGELVTPTGAALVRVLSTGPWPSVFVPVRSGFGAGSRDLAGRPNALRAVLAEVGELVETAHHQEVWQITADLDDMSPELVSVAADRLLAGGALDVVRTPVQMKKGRLGTRLDVLTLRPQLDELIRKILEETTSIGVRVQLVHRVVLPREAFVSSVRGLSVRMKVVTLPSGRKRAKPELDDARRVAEETGLSLTEIIAQALAYWERS